MRKILGRRGALATGIVGAACALMVGMSGPASADALLYENQNVNVKVTGGEAVAINQCIADAHDGVINYAQNKCDQMATGGNYVELDDSLIWVYQNGTWWPSVYDAKKVKVLLTGGISTAMNQCIADATDGVINYAQNECDQYAVAGNIVMAENVNVQIYQ